MQRFHYCWEAQGHTIVSGVFVAISILLMREVKSHLYFQQLLLLCGLLLSKMLLIKGKTYNDCFDDSSFFVDLFILFSRLVRLKLNIAEKAIFCDDDVEVILFDAKYFDRHDHVPFERIWSLFQ